MSQTSSIIRNAVEIKMFPLDHSLLGKFLCLRWISIENVLFLWKLLWKQGVLPQRYLNRNHKITKHAVWCKWKKKILRNFRLWKSRRIRMQFTLFGNRSEVCGGQHCSGIFLSEGNDSNWHQTKQQVHQSIYSFSSTLVG